MDVDKDIDYWYEYEYGSRESLRIKGKKMLLKLIIDIDYRY